MNASCSRGPVQQVERVCPSDIASSLVDLRRYRACPGGSVQTRTRWSRSTGTEKAPRRVATRPVHGTQRRPLRRRRTLWWPQPFWCSWPAATPRSGWPKVERVTFLDGLAGRPSHRRRPARIDQQFRYGPGHGRGIEAEDHRPFTPSVMVSGIPPTPKTTGGVRRPWPPASHRLVVLGEV